MKELKTENRPTIEDVSKAFAKSFQETKYVNFVHTAISNLAPFPGTSTFNNNEHQEDIFERRESLDVIAFHLVLTSPAQRRELMTQDFTPKVHIPTHILEIL